MNSKNLHNTTNFYIKQIFTAFDQEKKLQPPQKEILDLIEKNLSELNQIKIETVTKKTMKEVKKNEKDRQEISDSVIF